jgi:thymidine kinase
MTRMGTLVVVRGPMFSGKTEALIAHVVELRRLGVPVAVLKPAIDTRHPADRIVSHAGQELDARTFGSSAELVRIASDAEAVAIDEVQFLSGASVQVIDDLRRAGRAFFTVGLDRDFRLEPFSATESLSKVATRVEQLSAVCGVCGAAANLTQRLVNGSPASLRDAVISIGDRELYSPRCETCWTAERDAVRSAS